MSAQPQTFDAPRYVVSPWEQLGANVYVPYPDRYQLGPGDMLTVTISSPYMDAQNFDLKLDPQGAFTIPTGNTKLVLRGKTLGEAEKMVNARIATIIKGGKATLALKELRTMSITVAGDAYLPGEYQMPAVGLVSIRSMFAEVRQTPVRLGRSSCVTATAPRRCSIFTIILSLAKRRWTSHFSRAM